MSQSYLYRIHPENKILQSVREINFCDAGFKERYDIQEWVESTPSILGEDLLIITKETSCFDSTRERPDLIAIDKSGCIVIIELKRDESGTNLEWQAIKYASYWSRFKPKEIVRVYAEYLRRFNDGSEFGEEKAESNIVDFIEENSISEINRAQRLILVSHRYAKEVTSAVHWLIDKYGVDIKCIQLIPFYDSDKESYYLQSNVILPVPGIDDLLIGASNSSPRAQTPTAGPVRKDDGVTRFFEQLRDDLRRDPALVDKPTKSSRWAGVGGEETRYYHFWFDAPVWENWGMSYWIDVFSENYSDKELKGKFCLSLAISKKHLLNKGVPESSIESLYKSLGAILDHFELYEEGGYIFVEKLFNMVNLSQEELLLLKHGLIELIQGTKSIIDECVTNDPRGGHSIGPLSTENLIFEKLNI